MEETTTYAVLLPQVAYPLIKMRFFFVRHEIGVVFDLNRTSRRHLLGPRRPRRRAEVRTFQGPDCIGVVVRLCQFLPLALSLF